MTTTLSRLPTGWQPRPTTLLRDPVARVNRPSVVAAYRTRMVNVLRKMGASPNEAEDICQGALLQALEDLKKRQAMGDEPIRRMTKWLTAAVANDLRDLKNKQARRERLGHRPLDEVLAAGGDPAGPAQSREPPAQGQHDSELDRLIADEERSHLQAALKRLPPPLYDVASAILEEGCTCAEAARRLNINDRQARRRWEHAYERLKSDMRSYYTSIISQTEEETLRTEGLETPTAEAPDEADDEGLPEGSSDPA